MRAANDNGGGRRTVRFKQADVCRALRAFQQSGIPIGRVEITAAGSIVVHPPLSVPLSDADAALAEWKAGSAH